MRRFPCLAVLLVLLSAVGATAQTVSSTTGSIDGKITDASNAVLPGVTVTITSPAMMGSRDTVTTETGTFRLTALTPGDYDATFELPGFATVKRTAVRVGAGFTATLNISMSVAGLEEAVTVTGASPVVDTQATKISTTFDSKKLATIPNGSNDPWAMLAETPSVTVTRIDVGGSTAGTQTGFLAYGTAGQRPYYEGINGTEGTGGNGNYVDMTSYDEVSVNAAANNAEMGPIGVMMVFVSKSGGNSYHGAAATNYEKESWQSRNIDAAQVAAGLTTTAASGLQPSDLNRLHKYSDNNASLGGFIKKDKLWWFGAYRYLNSQARYANFPVVPFATTLTTTDVKLTYQLTKNNKFQGYYMWNTKDQPNRQDAFLLSGTAVINLDTASTFHQHYHPRLSKIEYDSVLSDSTYFEIRTGQWGYNWNNTNYTSSPRLEDQGTNVATGGSRINYTNPRRNQVLGSVSYFKQGWGGSHNIKFGWEIFRETATTGDGAGSYSGTNGVVQILNNGAPLNVYLVGYPQNATAGVWDYGLYLQDTWRVSSKVSMNVGFRFDRYREFFSHQTHEADAFFPTAQDFPAVSNVFTFPHAMAPRFGITYDLSGNGKTVLKANTGLYWDNPGAGITGSNPNGQWQQLWTWSDLNKNGIWDPGENIKLTSASGGTATTSIDPNLKDPHTIEYAGWVEREVMANLGVRGGVVYRTQRNHYANYNSNQPFSAFNVPINVQDPGPDGVVGNADDGPIVQAFNLDAAHLALPVQNLTANIPNSDTHFTTFEITATKRMANHWSGVISYNITELNDQTNSFFGTNFRQNALNITPNDEINTGANGLIHSTSYAFKVTGTVQAPWKLDISPVYRFQSGQNYGRTFVAKLNYGNIRLAAEPLDTNRQASVNLTDVRVARNFAVGKGQLGPFLDFYNIFNANPEQTITWASGSAFLRPLTVVPPRIIRIGVKFDW